MRGISEAGLLALGDAAVRGSFERATAVLAAAVPEIDASAWLRLPLGEINRSVLIARLETIGDVLDCVVTCASCGEPMSLEVRVGDLVDLSADRLATSMHVDDLPTVEWSDGDTVVVAHAPCHADLAAAAAAADVWAARATLIDRCVTFATVAGRPVAPSDLGDDAIGAVGGLLDDLDPLADPVFALTCPECDVGFDAALDAAGYVYGELSSRGRRLLYEVDALAQRYGWSEAEILALSPARRARYLELAG